MYIHIYTHTLSLSLSLSLSLCVFLLLEVVQGRTISASHPPYHGFLTHLYHVCFFIFLHVITGNTNQSINQSIKHCNWFYAPIYTISVSYACIPTFDCLSVLLWALFLFYFWEWEEQSYCNGGKKSVSRGAGPLLLPLSMKRRMMNISCEVGNLRKWQASIHPSMHTCIAHIHICVHTSIHPYTHYIHACTHVHPSIHTHIYMHAYIRIHIMNISCTDKNKGLLVG